MSRHEYRKCAECGHGQYGYGHEPCELCEEKDCEDQDWPRCPHCFRAVEDWHEEFQHIQGNGDGAEIVMTCGRCEEKFESRMSVSYSFDSDKIKDPTPTRRGTGG